MPKNYEANEINNLLLTIRFATLTDPVYRDIPDPADPMSTIREYYAVEQKLHCRAKGENQMSINVMHPKEAPHIKYYGSPKPQPWTPEEIGQTMKNFNNLNTVIYNDVKEIFKDAKLSTTAWELLREFEKRIKGE